jgi:tetratricopeptide (TPR) repeat protein
MTKNVMLTEDYLIRQISILLAALQRIVGFKNTYMYVEAQISIDQALEEIFGLRADLVRQLDDQALLEAITYLDVLNLDKLQVAAEVFMHEGDVHSQRGDEAASIQSYTRALNFFLDVSLNGGAWNLPEPTEQIEELVEHLRSRDLDPDTLYGLYLYSFERKQWARAEELLARMAVFPDLTDEVARMQVELAAARVG